MPELSQTIKARDIGRKRNIEHFEVLEHIGGLLSKYNLDFEFKPISASKGTMIERVEEQYGKNALEAAYLTKVFANIHINNWKSNGISNEIRMNYNEKGMELSFGKVVLVCSNGMTAFRGDVINTYGKDKVSHEQAMELLKSWIITAEEKNKMYDDLIQGMRNQPVIKDVLTELIGDLEILAVKQAYCKGDTAPFNIGQVSSFTRALMDQAEDVKPIETVWDMYNVGTNLFKPNVMQMENIIESNLALTEFIVKKYSLN